MASSAKRNVNISLASENAEFVKQIGLNLSKAVDTMIAEMRRARAREAWVIENGKLMYPVKGATLIGSGPDAMNQISMIGNDMQLDSGVGTCGKEGQSVPVGVGIPTVRMENLTVGGTA